MNEARMRRRFKRGRVGPSLGAVRLVELDLGEAVLEESLLHDDAGLVDEHLELLQAIELRRARVP